MIDLDDIPASRLDIVKLHVELEELPAGTKCPVSRAEVREYVKAEGALEQVTLFRGRTAQLGGVRFWPWGYVEDDGSSVYVFFSQGHGSSLLGLGSGDGLTPEQFIALQYARDWRPRIRAARTTVDRDLSTPT